MVPAVKGDHGVAKGVLPAVVVKRIREMLVEGTRHLTRVAKACNVSTAAVRKIIDSDPELKALHDAAFEECMEDVEDAAFEMATNRDEHPVAREKMIEFLLKGRKRKTYGDDVDGAESAIPTKRIVIAPILPVLKVDGNGAPIQETKKAEVIDV